MEHTLLSGVLCTAWIAALCGALVIAADRGKQACVCRAIPASYPIYAAVVIVIGFLATLPSERPFAPGHALGTGLVLGGVFGIGAAFLSLASKDTGAESEWGALRAAASIAAPFALATGMTCIPLLWIRETLVDTLMGSAIGWLIVTIAFTTGILASKETDRRPLLPLTASLGFAVTTTTIAILGEMRGRVLFGSFANHVSWSTLGLTIAATAPFTLLVTALPWSSIRSRLVLLPFTRSAARLLGGLTNTPADRNEAAIGRGISAVVLVALFSYMLGRRGPTLLPAFQLIELGIVVGLLAWWLCAERTRSETPGNAAVRSWHQGGLAAFVVLAGVMGAYHIQAGIGVGVMLIGVWLIAALAIAVAIEDPAPETAGQNRNEVPGGTGQVATRLLVAALFGCLLLLYRLFASRFGDAMSGISLTDFYALCGFLCGALLPPILAGYILQARGGSGSGATLGRVTAAGAASLFAPATLVLLWDARCALAFMIGLALAVVVSERPSGDEPVPTAPTPAGGNAVCAELALPVSDSANAASLTPAMMALAIALALCQWTGHVLRWSNISRAEKTHLMGWSTAALIAIIVIVDFGARLAAWRRDRLESNASGGAPKGGSQ